MAVTVRDIADNEWVIRGIPAADGINSQTGELSTFYLKSAEISTSLLSATSVAVLLNIGGFARLAALNVGFCRSLGFTVEHTPIENEDGFPDNAEHVSVRMPKPGRTSRANRLREHAIWVQTDNEEPDTLFQMLRERAESWSAENDQP